MPNNLSSEKGQGGPYTLPRLASPPSRAQQHLEQDRARDAIAGVAIGVQRDEPLLRATLKARGVGDARRELRVAVADRAVGGCVPDVGPGMIQDRDIADNALEGVARA